MDDIISVINKSPTPFHFIATAREILTGSGFVELAENDEWDLATLPNKIFVVRDEGTIAAFNITDLESGLIFTSNLDFPCFKIKPVPGQIKSHCELLNVGEYGYGMWFTWMDRDLSIAGRVIYKDINGKKNRKLIHTEMPFCSIPSLASHLTTSPSNTAIFNIEDHFHPVVQFTNEDDSLTTKPPTLLKKIADECQCTVDNIIDYELFVISAENASLIGVNDDLLASQQISSIAQATIGLLSFSITEPKHGLTAFYGYDHENALNPSNTGFESDFIAKTLNRLKVPDQFYSKSSIFASVRIAAAYAYPGSGVCYRSGKAGVSQLDPKFTEQLFEAFSKSYLMYHQCHTTYDINNGSHELSYQLDINSIIQIGIPIYNMHCIRESAFVCDVEAFLTAVSSYFALSHS